MNRDVTLLAPSSIPDMNGDSKHADILVLGATGLTGKETTLYLAHHPEFISGTFTFSIAGRSKSKLEKLVKEISLPENVSVLVADVEKPQELEEIIQNFKVVINTVGPYLLWGTPVVDACVKHGVHYVDLTGETPWIRRVIRSHDYAATKTGSIIVPSCGFDSVPSDLSAFLAAKTLHSYCSSHSIPYPGINTSTTALDFKCILSNGTVSSVFLVVESIPKEELLLINRPYLLSPTVGDSQPAKLLHSLAVPGTDASLPGGIYFMGKINAHIVQRSWGLFEMWADPAMRYGRHFKYNEFLQTRSRAAAAVSNFVLMGLMGLMMFAPTRWVLKKLSSYFTSFEAPHNLHNVGYIHTTNVTTSETSLVVKSPIQVKTTISGHGDPGYYLTCIILAEAALSLSVSYDALSRRAKEGGVLTPMSAMGDVLIQRIKNTGKFEIESTVVEIEGEENRKQI